jgi:hypothetical protein
MGILSAIKRALGIHGATRAAQDQHGMEFHATLQLRTPLNVLRHHGEVHDHTDTDPPVYAAEEWQGIWLPRTSPEFDFLSEGETMSSDVGSIPADGGDYLPFLISVREIVEDDGPIEERRERLRAALKSTPYPHYVRTLGGVNKVLDQFFPSFLASIGGLTQQAIRQLEKSNLRTPRQLLAASDETLLAVKGIGPAKLERIRTACADAPDKDAMRIDNSRSESVGPKPFLQDEMTPAQFQQEYLKRGGDPTRKDHMVFADICADNAAKAATEGRRDDAWRYLNEQSQHYMQAGLPVPEMLRLCGLVHKKQAEVLKTEGKNHDALCHLIYWLATQGEEVSESREKVLRDCFEMCRFEDITFDEAKTDLYAQDRLHDFNTIELLVRKWRGEFSK